MSEGHAGYRYGDANPGWVHAYLLPSIPGLIDGAGCGKPKKSFGSGTGNGAFANALVARGHDAMGIDYSASEIEHANRAYPALRILQGSAYDGLQSRSGQFPIVLGVEVNEHRYFPRFHARRASDLLAPGGTLLSSTPLHGY